MPVPPRAFNAQTCFPGSLAGGQVSCSGHKAHPTVSTYTPAAPGGRPEDDPSHPDSDLSQQTSQSSLFLNSPLPAAAAQDRVSSSLGRCLVPAPPVHHQGSGMPLTVFDECYTYLQATNTCCDKKYKTREIKLHRLLFQLGIMTPPASAS